jgi:hypothetical protein
MMQFVLCISQPRIINGGMEIGNKIEEDEIMLLNYRINSVKE